MSGTPRAAGPGLFVKVFTSATSALLSYVGLSLSLSKSRLSMSSATASFQRACSQGTGDCMSFTPAATSLSTADLETEGLHSEFSLNLLM